MYHLSVSEEEEDEELQIITPHLNEAERQMSPEPPEEMIPSIEAQDEAIPIIQAQDEVILEEAIDEAFTRPIQPGERTEIKIRKGSSGLGLSIVGGSDTLLVSFRTCLHAGRATLQRG